ncbi:hypothetical protein BDB01DRAFT_834996 [Pilobolus umbonatus]|nr:hypothetical protein BDB01DRAFT_834996 [Pilobolus umbonatus]
MSYYHTNRLSCKILDTVFRSFFSRFNHQYLNTIHQPGASLSIEENSHSQTTEYSSDQTGFELKCSEIIRNGRWCLYSSGRKSKLGHLVQKERDTDTTVILHLIHSKDESSNTGSNQSSHLSRTSVITSLRKAAKFLCWITCENRGSATRNSRCLDHEYR